MSTTPNEYNSDYIKCLLELLSTLRENRTILLEMNETGMRMVRYADKVIGAQNEEIDKLKQQAETANARIAQYEAAFSFESFKDAQRLN